MMGSTNYASTFIQVADDCPVDTAELPPSRGKAPTAAALQFTLISENPYTLTSDEVLFEVHAIRNSITADARTEAREKFFAKDQACLRSSALGKRYGWGIHHDAEGRVALLPRESPEYREVAADSAIKQVKAMRSKRA